MEREKEKEIKGIREVKNGTKAWRENNQIENGTSSCVYFISTTTTTTNNRRIVHWPKMKVKQTMYNIMIRDSVQDYGHCSQFRAIIYTH